MFENIYDLIKVCALSNRQNDEWAQLSRKFGEEAKKEMRRFLRYKNLEWDGERNIISLGRNFKFKLITT